MPHSALQDILILLGAAVIVVTCFRKLNLSPVLGYLIAGIAIGPYGMELVNYTSTTSSIAEFGVVFLLFYIGLELNFERLKSMRSYVFGLGFCQVTVTSAIFIGAALLFGLNFETALIVGTAFSLSSTAVVLKVLSEQGDEMSKVGRTSIALLIFQDIVVVFLLVLVPLLAHDNPAKIVTTLTLAGAKAALALAIIVVIGKFFIRPMFNFISQMKSEELFSATTLLILLASAFITEHFGLSMALGAFLAGLMIAETEFRHQVEADIMPYKSLLLGLFFMSVGMLVDITLLQEKAFEIAGIAIGVLVIKGGIIFFLCRAFGLKLGHSAHSGLMLAQIGEFAFILFGLANRESIMGDALYQELLVATALTMAVTPAMAHIGKRIGRKLNRRIKLSNEELEKETSDLSHHIIICGFGRVGRVIAKVLLSEHENFIAIDNDITNVREGRKIGIPVLYGDSSKLELLQSVGLRRARAVIITYNDRKASSRAVSLISSDNKHLPIIARGWDTEHVKQLEKAGANLALAEAYEIGLQMVTSSLNLIGTDDQEVERILRAFRHRDYARLKALSTPRA